MTAYTQTRPGIAPGSQQPALDPRRSMSKEFEKGLISCILADESVYGTVEPIVSWSDFGSNPDGSLTPEKAIARAIWECGAQTPPKIPTKLNVIGQLQRLDYWLTIVDPAYLQHLDDQGTPDIVAGAPDYAERIAKLARARLLYRTLRGGLRELEASPDDVDTIGESLLETMLPILQGATVAKRDGSSRAIRRNRKGTGARIATGLTWFDNAVGGLQSGRALGIAAKSGGRKTGTSLNLALGPVLAGVNVDYYSIIDNTREEIRDQIITMRATSLLRHWHESGERSDCGPDTWTLTPDNFAGRVWLPVQQEAITIAEDEFDTYGFSAYDADDGIIDLPHAIKLARANIRQNNTQLVIVDYMQAHTMAGIPDDNDYAMMRKAVMMWGRLIKQENVAAIFVSQMNKDDDVRGGQQLRELCYNLVYLGYNSKEHPDSLTIALEKNRFSALSELTYAINPSSSLIMNPRRVS